MKEVMTIPFEFDTGPIERRLQENGYELVMLSLTDKCEAKMLSTLSKKGGYWRETPETWDEVDWKDIVYRRINQAIDDNVDEIIQLAALMLAKRVGSRKKWKEIADEAWDDMHADKEE